MGCGTPVWDTLGGMRKSGFVRRFALVVVLVTALAACGGATSATDTTKGTEVADVATTQQIIDVRTPEEFADGHVQSAVNLNVEDGSLDAALAGLDPAADYVVYCRSGRRSAIAAQLMADRGFTKVTDLGTPENAATTLGAPVVSG